MSKKIVSMSLAVIAIASAVYMMPFVPKSDIAQWIDIALLGAFGVWSLLS